VGGGVQGGLVVSLSGTAQTGELDPAQWGTNAALGGIFGAGAYGFSQFGKAGQAAGIMLRDGSVSTGTAWAHRKDGC
jgi:hypothetical protein